MQAQRPITLRYVFMSVRTTAIHSLPCALWECTLGRRAHPPSPGALRASPVSRPRARASAPHHITQLRNVEAYRKTGNQLGRRRYAVQDRVASPSLNTGLDLGLARRMTALRPPSMVGSPAQPALSSLGGRLRAHSARATYMPVRNPPPRSTLAATSARLPPQRARRRHTPAWYHTAGQGIARLPTHSTLSEVQRRMHRTA
ncbi:hypothetical protein BC628DRAFT_423483 [Trametes gibbosa]|nr:hypothetical protein BC628DRAFT_423483 [Trametes gibbosa]